MDEENLEYYQRQLTMGNAQRAKREAHSWHRTYKFLLSGSMFLLHKLIQLPILDYCVPDQPGNGDLPSDQKVHLHRCIEKLAEHVKGDLHQDAITRSSKRTDKKDRLGRRIWKLRETMKWAEICSGRAKRGEWDIMNDKDRKLTEAFDGGKLKIELENLLAQQRPGYKGVGPSIQVS